MLFIQIWPLTIYRLLLLDLYSLPHPFIKYCCQQQLLFGFNTNSSALSNSSSFGRCEAAAFSMTNQSKPIPFEDVILMLRRKLFPLCINHTHALKHITQFYCHEKIITRQDQAIPCFSPSKCDVNFIVGLQLFLPLYPPIKQSPTKPHACKSQR